MEFVVFLDGENTKLFSSFFSSVVGNIDGNNVVVDSFLEIVVSSTMVVITKTNDVIVTQSNVINGASFIGK